MIPNAGEVLRALRDVEGVFGSFVADSNGATTARDLPSWFDDESVGQASARVPLLLETLGSGESAVHVATLEFADYKLHVRPFNAGILCVVTQASVNVAALNLALQLVTRRLEAASSAARAAMFTGKNAPPAPPLPVATPTARTAPAPAGAPLPSGRGTFPPPEPPAAPPSSQTKPVRLYRGRPVE